MLLLCFIQLLTMEITAFSEQEIQQLRAETRGTAERIHFNNAGASVPRDVVRGSIITYVQEEASYGGDETEYKYREQLDNVYSLIARLIHSEKEEVAIVENASIAWGLAFNGIAFERGDEVITSEMEYVTNLIGFLNAQKTHGIVIKVIPNDEQGVFSLSALEEAISPQTKLIAITHIPSSSGAIFPIVEIAHITPHLHLLYLLFPCHPIT